MTALFYSLGGEDMALFNPGGLARQLCDRWEQIPLLKTYNCPPAAQLTNVIEAAYLVSMESEEGRPLKFGLILRPSGENDESEYGIARFKERRPLSSSEIRRLAPATSLSSTFIAVELAESGPFIWGTVDVGSEWALLQRGEQTSGMTLPFQLVITVTAPGTISLKFGDSVLYSAERGQPAQESCNVLKFGPVHDFFRPIMIRLLNKVIPDHDKLFLKEFLFISYGGQYLRFLARTLKYAEELGHGGAIIVLREEDEARVGELVSIKYLISNCNLWDELVRYVQLTFEEIESWKLIDDKPQVDREPLDRWRNASREREKLSQRLNDRSRFLARLTQVDGALVLTDCLRVLGFGGIIKDLAETQPTVRSCQDESCRTFNDLQRQAYGTRHRSAIMLCEQIDCVAFVLSEDGGVKALRREDGRMLLWPSILLDPAAWFVTPEDMEPELKERYLNRNRPE